jgi:hypothetical protein
MLLDVLISLILSAPGIAVFSFGVLTIWSAVSGHIVWGGKPIEKKYIVWLLAVGTFFILFGLTLIVGLTWQDAEPFWIEVWGILIYLWLFLERLITVEVVVWVFLILFLGFVLREITTRIEAVPITDDLSYSEAYAGVQIRNRGFVSVVLVARVTELIRFEEKDGETQKTKLDLNWYNPRGMNLMWKNGRVEARVLPNYPDTIIGVYAKKSDIAFRFADGLGGAKLSPGEYLLEIAVYRKFLRWIFLPKATALGELSIVIVKSDRYSTRPILSFMK